MDNTKIAMRVSRMSIFVNIALSLGKLAAGIIARSGAMISDAVHSASDVLSTLAVMAGIKLASRRADSSHPYGHERVECIFSILLAVILCATGIGIGYSGVTKIIGGGELVVPGALALAAAVVSIVVKELMFQYTKKNAKKIHSTALMADAWHHRSDALSSIGSFIGILGARLGFPICDPIASVIICIFIVKAAWDIFMDAVNQLIDKSGSDEECEKIREVALGTSGVVGVDDLKTRLFGSKMYVDIEIGADGTLPLTEAHAIAQNVHDSIEREFSEVKHCMVHVNPKVVDKTE